MTSKQFANLTPTERKAYWLGYTTALKQKAATC